MKLYSCDGKMFSLGSFNSDYWSWGVNSELNAVVENNVAETEELEKLIQ